MVASSGLSHNAGRAAVRAGEHQLPPIGVTAQTPSRSCGGLDVEPRLAGGPAGAPTPRWPRRAATTRSAAIHAARRRQVTGGEAGAGVTADRSPLSRR